MPTRDSAARVTRGIPFQLDGRLCTCAHGSRPGPAHAPTYLLELDGVQFVGCTSAAAAFAAQHGLAFPLTAVAAASA